MKFSNMLLAARVSIAKGIKGNFIVQSFLENHDIFTLTLFDQENKVFQITKLHSLGKNYFLCKSDYVISRNDAYLLKNKKLFCVKSDLTKLKDDSFFINELLNLKVINNATMEEIGYIKNILTQTSYDVLEVNFYNKNKTEFFIFSESNFPEVQNDFIMIDSNIL